MQSVKHMYIVYTTLNSLLTVTYFQYFDVHNDYFGSSALFFLCGTDVM